MSGETKITFNGQPRDAEEILNSCTNSKYKLLNGSRTTWQCIVSYCVIMFSPPQSTHKRFTRTYFISKHSKMCQGGMRVNSARLTVPPWIHRECRWLSRHAVAFELHGDFESCFVRWSHTNFQPQRIPTAAFFEALGRSNTSWKSESPIAKEKGRDFETTNPQTRRHCFDHAVVQSSWSTNTFRSTTKDILIGPDSHLLLTTFFCRKLPRRWHGVECAPRIRHTNESSATWSVKWGFDRTFLDLTLFCSLLFVTSFRKVPFRFVPFRFAKYRKPFSDS